MTDDVIKSATLKAPLERVWTAITDPPEFGAWFGAEWDTPFTLGETASGRIVPTKVDADVAASQRPFAGTPLTLHIDELEPMRRFAFRWTPSPESQALTTVAFELAEGPGGVELTITEAGFDALEPNLRDAAREQNDGGWEAQTRLIARYLDVA